MSLADRLLAGDCGRTLVVVAHPDDEAIGAGILLSRLPDCRVVHVTDGAPRDPRFVAEGFHGTIDEYARTRREELAAAMALAGIGPDRLIQIAGIADQEAAFAMPRLAREIAGLCRDWRPEIVLTLAYEGGHPDHDAAALAVQAAREALRREGAEPPVLWEIPLYHARPDGELAVQEPLPAPDGSPGGIVRIELSEEDRRLKERMLACFATQQQMLASFLPPIHESFRPAPLYDFTRPPHEGTLQYEIWGFPITGERWRELAREAIAELDLRRS